MKIEPAKIDKIIGEFGVGCVHFRPKDIEQKFASFETYAELLKSSLAQITAIQDIALVAENSFHNFRNGIPTPFSLLEETEYPDLASCTGILFELTLILTIPERTQREILETEGWEGWAPAKSITAHFAYQYDTPIMLVYLDGQKQGRADASSCVRLVREFLRLEMEKSPTCEFTVDVLGPSPFHSDFTVRNSDEIKDGIKWDRKANRGYDAIDIAVPLKITSFQQLINHLEQTLFDDFDLFYMLMLEQAKVMDNWHLCFGAVKTFEASHRGAGRLRRAFSLLVPIGNTYDLVSKIADFRLTSMTANGRVNERISNNAFIKESAIWKDIDTEMKTFPKYDIDSLEKLVDFVDRKQTHKQTGANTLFAAIAGAITGALVAWLMQIPVHHPVHQNSPAAVHIEKPSPQQPLKPIKVQSHKKDKAT